MPLNVKLALLMSVGVIAGFFYALQGIDSRTLSLPSPLASTAGAAPGNTRMRLPTSDPASRRLNTPSPVAERPFATGGASPSHVETIARAAPTPAPLLPPRSPDANSTPDADHSLEIADRPVLLTAVRPPTEPVSAAPEVTTLPPTARASAIIPIKTEPGDSARRYTVKPGDTLVRIARRELQSGSPEAVQRILDANPALKARPDRVLVGTELVMPDTGNAAKPPVADTASRARVAGPPRNHEPARVADARFKAAAQADATIVEPRGPRTYTVRPNDSLRSIAAKVLKDSARWRELAKLNAISNGDRIRAGTVLRLPPERVASR